MENPLEIGAERCADGVVSMPLLFSMDSSWSVGLLIFLSLSSPLSLLSISSLAPIFLFLPSRKVPGGGAAPEPLFALREPQERPPGREILGRRLISW